MEANTSVNRRMTNSTDKAPLPLEKIVSGQGTNMSVNARMGNTTKAPISFPLGINTLVNGRMAGTTDKAPKPLPAETNT